MLLLRSLSGTAEMLYGDPHLFWSGCRPSAILQVLLVREVSCCSGPLKRLSAGSLLGFCVGLKTVQSGSCLAAERRGRASHAVGLVPHGGR